MEDVDGNRDDRSGTISVFNGPPPAVRVLANDAAEVQAVGAWLRERAADGILAHECGVFVRSEGQMARAVAAVSAAGLSHQTLDNRVSTASGRVAVGTMHLAKGLEFRAVAVMACDDEVMPLQSRVAAVGDDADLKDVYDTERQLLYVACTRARDYLHVSGVEPASEFLDDLGRRSLN
jgi:superfamily I DNA/RNA helicase